MAKRDKRETRFSMLKSYYEMHKSGILGNSDEESLAKAKANVEFARDNNGVMMFESELEKFAEKYPQIDIVDFTQFVTATGGLKTTASKGATGERESHTRLNTPEAAIERGVAEDKVAEYISEVEQIYVLAKSINSKMDNARVSFAIPKTKVADPNAETQP